MTGGRTRARTWDPLIKSQLLYQLSYAPVLPSAGSPPGGVRLAKVGKSVQPRKVREAGQRRSRRMARRLLKTVALFRR